MLRLPTLAAVLTALLLLAGCGADDTGDTVSDPIDDAPIPVEPDEGIGDGAGPPAGDTEVTGTLGGSGELEGGCGWIDGDDGTRYEVQYPEGFELRFDPVRLLDADGEVVAEEGDTLTVRGGVEADGMSFCQVGTIFTATDVEV